MLLQVQSIKSQQSHVDYVFSHETRIAAKRIARVMHHRAFSKPSSHQQCMRPSSKLVQLHPDLPRFSFIITDRFSAHYF